jgi:hypothetical protein
VACLSLLTLSPSTSVSRCSSLGPATDLLQNQRDSAEIHARASWHFHWLSDLLDDYSSLGKIKRIPGLIELPHAAPPVRTEMRKGICTYIQKEAKEGSVTSVIPVIMAPSSISRFADRRVKCQATRAAQWYS